jgi:hypothetical protein
MNRRRSSMAVAVSLAISAPAFAGDSNALPATPREMAHCMMKRLKANNSESYRAAFKACKDQFAAPAGQETAMTVTPAMTEPPKPAEQRP